MTDQEARSAAQTDCPGCDDSTCTHREGCILDEAFDKADERSAATITHGRHCTCSACERQDWTEPQLACCGMHGPICPPVYAPLGAPGQPDPSAAQDRGGLWHVPRSFRVGKSWKVHLGVQRKGDIILLACGMAGYVGSKWLAPTVDPFEEVTCKHCLRAVAK